jgi:basic membrane protein A
MAHDGLNLVVGVGFTARQPIAELAPKFPNVHFLLVDDAVERSFPNVRSIQFREQEAGFLAGVVAGLVTKTGKVAVVTGIDLPVVRRYVNGYKEGVKHINPSATVLVSFAGSFSDPAKGKELSLGLYAAGADVILNGAGQTGNGIFEAAKSTHRYAIGVDQDQSAKAPENVLTSALKKVDVAIYTAVKEAVGGRFLPGSASLGVSDGAIDLAPLNEKMVLPDVRRQIEAVLVAMKRGEIKVSANYAAP